MKNELTARNHKVPQQVKDVIVAICRWTFFIAFSYVLLYPLLFMISSCLKSPSDYIDPTVTWIPKNITFEFFGKAVEALNLKDTMWNTFRLEIVSALIEVASCAIAAYGMARFRFPEKNICFALVLLTILVPAQMTIIPMVMNFKQLDFLGILGLIGGAVGKELRPNVLDTVWTFYLPSILGVGLKSGIMIYIYTQFFKGLPYELEEAAWVDGAGPIKTFLRIVVPSSGVAFLTVAIFSVIWHWNDYYLAIMYTSSNYPISVALSNLYDTVKALYNLTPTTNEATAIIMGSCFISILPMLIMYLILQKKFIESVNRVGIVG